jgi:MoaA/NifB/PqqE/SkfB family radical SAM enzyme
VIFITDGANGRLIYGVESRSFPPSIRFPAFPVAIPQEVSMQPMRAIPARGELNFDETPFLAIWEVTQSCDLACKHCRAAAQPLAHPDELTTAEGKALIDQIAAMGVPIFVFTGGDPMKRKDVFELIRYAAAQGVHY